MSLQFPCWLFFPPAKVLLGTLHHTLDCTAACTIESERNAWDYIDRGMGGGLEEREGNQGPGKEMIFRDERRREVPGKL